MSLTPAHMRPGLGYAPPFVYLGRKVVTDAATLDFSWTLDCELVVLEYRNCRPRSASERFNALRLSNDGGSTFLVGTSYNFRSTGWVTTQFSSVVLGGANIARPTGATATAGQNNSANEFGNWTVFLVRPFDTSQNTRLWLYGGWDNTTGNPTAGIGGGQRLVAERNDAIRMEYHKPGGSQVDNMDGEVRAYGLLRYPGGAQAAPSYSMAERVGLAPRLDFIDQKVASNQQTLDFAWGDRKFNNVYALIDNAAPVTGGESIACRLSGDNGNSYFSIGYVGRGSALGSSTATASAATHLHLTETTAATGDGPANGADANSGMSALVTIHSPSDTGKKTAVTSMGSYLSDAPSEFPCASYGFRDTADAVNGFQLLVRNGAFSNLDRARVTLWGERST